MEYVEILRAKRILTWLSGFLLAGLIIETISFYANHGHVEGNGTVGFASLVGVAVIAALIVATLVGSGLSAEAANTTALIWTRPAPRDEIAARYVGIDVAAIFAAHVVTVVAIVLGIAVIGGLPAITFDPASIVRTFLLAFGGALMWYAVISVVASRLPGRGLLIAGLTWGVFPILAGLFHAHSFPMWLHDVIYALNFLNPTAWLGSMVPQGNSSIIPLGVWQRILGEWLIAIALLVASVRLWSTREI